jgi:hypothetical protein
MATDYIVFIHGVNNRSQSDFQRQAENTFNQIQANINPISSRKLKSIILFWGDIAEDSVDVLLGELRDSPTWKKFWFKEFRESLILNFVGDAILYLSRNVSIEIIQQMIMQALKQLNIDKKDLKNNSIQDGDRLHLVTHSWGTVILFDILFADRWTDPQLSENTRESVNLLRSAFFGIGNPEIRNIGIPIASIHTMGSPISLFNLLNSSNKLNRFNLTPKLKEFLSSLYERTGKPLPWCNYAHPGDPIAYPLKGIMQLSLGDAGKFVEIEDIITPASSWLRFFDQSIFSIVQGGKAHSSYWNEPLVIKMIAQSIQSSRNNG